LALRLRTGKRGEVPRGERFDVVIIGAGPAGLSAAMYSARFLLKTLVVSQDVGGQLNLTNIVEDYPGLGKIGASELVSRFKSHAEEFKAKIVTGVQVDNVEKSGDEFIVTGTRGFEARAGAVIIAVGSKRRKLGVPGEEEFQGRGVSYCSICDGPLFKGRKSVAVVGGGDSALEGALLLSGYVEKVYLIHRRRQFRAKPYYVEQVKARGNIELVLDTVVRRIEGGETVERVIVENKVTGERRSLDVEGIFIEIGFEPMREWFQKLGLEVDEAGYIRVDEWMRTNIEGLFAAGDCTSAWIGFRQVVTAAAMGAVAAYSAYNYLSEKGLYQPKVELLTR
jgi:thioredoxin reductase (NADPH)